MLANHQTDQLQQVVDIIVTCALPEKIFLLGVSCVSRHEENIFIQSNSYTNGRQQVTQYYVLILNSKESKQIPGELADAIENRCLANATPVIIYMEAIHIFNDWLRSGHPFACCVVKQGCLVYDAGQTPLANPGAITVSAPIPDLTRCDTNISEFLAGAELYRLRRQFSLAAFLLHQAAEQAFSLIIRLITGYRVVTHNLEKLFCYARPFLPELDVCFNKQNNKEQGLLKLLQQAYIHSRYREDYNIKESELDILMARVKKLHVLVQKVSNERRVINKKETSP